MKKLILVALLLVLTAGCAGDLVRSRVESGIANALPKYIGPAKKYRVKAYGSSNDMLNGLIDHLHIEGTEVEIYPRLLVRDIVVDMREVRYNNKRQLKSAKDITFTGILSQDAVNNYIQGGEGGKYDLKLELDSRKVRVNFIPRVLGIDILVKLDGRPEVVGGNKINFTADQASVAHLPVPSFVVNKVLDSVNPILDMSLMKFPVQLEKINVKDGAVEISGRADWKPAEE